MRYKTFPLLFFYDYDTLRLTMRKGEVIGHYGEQFPKLRPLSEIFTLGRVSPEKTMLAGGVWTYLDDLVASFAQDPEKRSYPSVVGQAKELIEQVARLASEDPFATSEDKTFVFAAQEAVAGNPLSVNAFLRGDQDVQQVDAILATAHLVHALNTRFYDGSVGIIPDTLAPKTTLARRAQSLNTPEAKDATDHLRAGLIHLARAMAAKK